MIDFETSVLRWKENRDKVIRSDFFYKKGVLDKAFEKLKNQDIEITHLFNSLKGRYDYLLDTDREYILHMIEDTTPGPCHMNLSPEHDLGIPHGLWKWDYRKPDVMVDEVTKTEFPNDKYPETGVLETQWGRPQKFTYYTGKSIEYNKYHIYASFSGKVRFYKVQYMTEAAYNLAFLYCLTGKIEYAKKSKEILMRFAEVYPFWLAHGMYGDIADMDPKKVGNDPLSLPSPRTCLPPNEPKNEIHVGFWSLGRATASGQEGGGFILPICITYSMIADVLTKDSSPLFSRQEKDRIEKDILLESITLVINDTKLNNKSCSNRFAAIAVGMLTGVKEYIDFGIEGFEKIIDNWYLKDGSTSESASYSMMVMGSLWIAAELIDGYRGIDGKEDPVFVFDNYKYKAIWKGMYDTLIQNLQYPASADCRQKTSLSELYVKILAYRFRKPEFIALLKKLKETDSKNRSIYHVLSVDELPDKEYELKFRDLFFPEFRQGYLRIGEKNKEGTLMINASDWGAHHHLDSLNIFYYWNGTEWLSDLGYLWDQPQRNMTVRTPAHNLVLIDQKEQVRQGRGGNLNSFGCTPMLKFTDVSSKAYPNADVYRRAVLVIRPSLSSHYIIDLFHVHGGNTQEYILHGPSNDYCVNNASLVRTNDDMPYQLEDAFELMPLQGSSIQWWDDKNNIFSVYLEDTEYENCFITKGWGQRGATDVGATLPYLLRRHKGKNPYTFITLFGANTLAPSVKSYKTTADKDYNMVVIEVLLQSGEKDIIVYRFNSNKSALKTENYVIEFDGTCAILADIHGKCTVNIFGGTCLKVSDMEFENDKRSYQGVIKKYDFKGFYVDIPFDEAKTWIGNIIYVEDNEKATGYPVMNVTIESGLVKVTTIDENGEGFAFSGGLTWRIIGVKTFNDKL